VRKKLPILVAMALMLAMMLVAGAGSVFAKAYTEESGGLSQGNITQEANQNCDANLRKQNEAEVAAGEVQSMTLAQAHLLTATTSTSGKAVSASQNK
jgi:hypothetical protein